MKMHNKLPAFTVLALAAATAAAAPAPGEHISFVSCPVVRDTRSVPCWISEYEGTTYYLTIQSDVSAVVQPPMLGHQVLVEGKITDQPQICGGVVLEDVRLSVMPELDGNCNRILPVDDRYVIDFNPRPPGPSAGGLAFAGPPPGNPRAAPTVAGPQSVDIYFDFDKGVSFRHPGDLTSVMSMATQIGAQRMIVRGVRGAHRLSNGTLLQEAPQAGQRRAEELAKLFAGAGVTIPITVEWIDGSVEADGIEDWRTRRVTVELLP